MINANKKNYPKITKARKMWVFIVAGIMFFMVLLIIHNLAASRGFAEKQNTDAPKTVAQLPTSNDTDWYQKPKVQQEIRNLYLGKNNSDDNTVNAGSNSDLQKAMQASISSNQITADNSNANFQAQNSPPAQSQNNTSQNNQNTDQNMQSEKRDFIYASNKQSTDYLDSSLQFPQSPFELQAGNIIPAVLITGINSDLPGQIIAQVKSNVYDSIAGNSLLIPQGTKVVGVYDSQIAYGQERVLVAWQRLIFPNGQSFDLEGMPGIDLSGYAGFNDQVNNHYGKIFGSVVLLSILSAGAQLSQPQQSSNGANNSQTSINQMIAQSLGTNIANTGTMLTQKNINIQPTLEIRPGYELNISVTKDMVFPGAYTA